MEHCIRLAIYLAPVVQTLVSLSQRTKNHYCIIQCIAFTYPPLEQLKPVDFQITLSVTKAFHRKQ